MELLIKSFVGTVLLFLGIGVFSGAILLFMNYGGVAAFISLISLVIFGVTWSTVYQSMANRGAE